MVRRRKHNADRSWINIGYVESEANIVQAEGAKVQEFVEQVEHDVSSSEEEDLDTFTPDVGQKVTKKLNAGSDTTILRALPPDATEHNARVGSGVAFDLEMWWRKSPKLVRFNALIIVLLLILALAHTIIGVIFIIQSIFQKKPSAYVCQSEECHKAAVYMLHPMNFSVDPCDNFYEFMCGKYEETMPQGQFFAEFLEIPGFKLELGEESVLSKILRDFRGDDTYDQSIRFYQSCLNEPNKKTHRMEALVKRIETIFGTRDFRTFETSTSPSLEQIAAQLFRTVGHGFYINFAFGAYPYINLLTPALLLEIADFNIGDNRIFVENVCRYLCDDMLGLPTSWIGELVNGVGYWSELTNSFWYGLIDMSHAVAVDENRFHSYLKDNIPAGFCPPMGIKLDLVEVFSDFLKVRWSEQYFDTSARKYWVALRWCFDQPAANFDFATHNITSNRKRLAFVSIWLFGLVHHVVTVLHNDFIHEVIPKSVLTNLSSSLKDEILKKRVSTVQVKCMEELWKSLGYMPSLRYLAANFEDPIAEIASAKKEVKQLYHQTRELFWQIPQKEIHRFAERQGRLIFGRDLHVDVMMPLLGETLDEFKEMLEFTDDDHLANHFIALNLTIESGRMYWMSSPDPVSVPKWWGYGGLQLINNQLFEIRFPFVSPARFEEEDGAFTQGRWSKVLGRRSSNYILYSLALITEPHITETLALKMAGSTLKVIRTHLALPELTGHHFIYPYYNYRGIRLKDRDDLLWRSKMRKDNSSDYDPDYPNSNRTCHALYLDPQNSNELYEYGMEEINVQELSSTDDFYKAGTFYNIMALKIAFKVMKMKRKEIKAAPYKSLDPLWRKLRIQKRLPGALAGYNEDKLFFMAYVRHLCRSSWKKDNSVDFFYKEGRYDLETKVLNTLMQSEEFSKTWKCKKHSFMNNKGFPKCFTWVP